MTTISSPTSFLSLRIIFMREPWGFPLPLRHAAALPRPSEAVATVCAANRKHMFSYPQPQCAADSAHTRCKSSRSQRIGRRTDRRIGQRHTPFRHIRVRKIRLSAKQDSATIDKMAIPFSCVDSDLDNSPSRFIVSIPFSLTSAYNFYAFFCLLLFYHIVHRTVNSESRTACAASLRPA